jgi:phosphoribosylformylglycinamidine synthase
MSAYEMMLSESQERMLMVLDPARRAQAEAVFTKWGLDFAEVGVTTDNLRFQVSRHGDIVADLPIRDLGDQAPEYDRPWVPPEIPAPLDLAAIAEPADLGACLKQLIGSPDMASRRWIWEQYDYLVQGNTIQKPGGDAAIVRIDGKTKALALTSDVTPRYVEANPFEGGKQAVAECWRNLTAVGALPLAVTDNLNFGNPERPEIMGRFVRAIEGIGEACLALGFPVVSGNVSLYNETNGEGILPTPTIAGIGLIDDWRTSATIGFKSEGDTIVLIGAQAGPETPWGSHLGQSIYLREIEGREDGDAPAVDLAAEKRHGDFVRELIQAGRVSAVHDLSDGGLAIAIAEMAIASGLGARLDTPNGPQHAAFFGEDQARYVVTAPEAEAIAILQDADAAGVTALIIGSVGGQAVHLGMAPPIDVKTLSDHHENWLPDYMGET